MPIRASENRWVPLQSIRALKIVAIHFTTQKTTTRNSSLNMLSLPLPPRFPFYPECACAGKSEQYRRQLLHHAWSWSLGVGPAVPAKRREKAWAGVGWGGGGGERERETVQSLKLKVGRGTERGARDTEKVACNIVTSTSMRTKTTRPPPPPPPRPPVPRGWNSHPPGARVGGDVGWG